MILLTMSFISFHSALMQQVSVSFSRPTQKWMTSLQISANAFFTIFNMQSRMGPQRALCPKQVNYFENPVLFYLTPWSQCSEEKHCALQWCSALSVVGNALQNVLKTIKERKNASRVFPVGDFIRHPPVFVCFIFFIWWCCVIEMRPWAQLWRLEHLFQSPMIKYLLLYCRTKTN